MAKKFTWMQGINVTIAITPQDAAADGTLSDNAIGTLVLKGRWNTADGNFGVDTENVSPADCPQRNPIVNEIGMQYTIEEYLDAAGTASTPTGNKLQMAARTSYYHKIVVSQYNAPFVQGGAAVIQTETLYVLMTGYDPSYKKGACTGRMVVETIGLPTATPGVYTNNPGFA